MATFSDSDWDEEEPCEIPLSPIVIDQGSGYIKAGFADKKFFASPHAIFRTVVGYPKNANLSGFSYSHKMRDCYIGQDAEDRARQLHLKSPLKNGNLSDEYDLEKIYHHIFHNEFEIDPYDRYTSVLVSESCLLSRAGRQKICEILFETFGVDNFYLASQGMLSLYSSGLTTGLVLDIGHGLTQITPVYEGYALQHASQHSLVAGEMITQRFEHLMEEDGIRVSNWGLSKDEILRHMKHKLCGVRSVGDDEKEDDEMFSRSVEYELPDGTKLNLGDSRFECSEILFNPGLMGKDWRGVPQLVSDCLSRCSVDVRADLMASGLLCGGTMNMNGLVGRLRAEFGEINRKYKWSTPSLHGKSLKPSYTSFTGGAILASLDVFDEHWMTREEYDECGVNLVTYKCF